MSFTDLFLDFETFYQGKQGDIPAISLSSLSYSKYILHPEMAILGAAIRYQGEDFYLDPDEFPKWANTIDWSTTRFIAHNAQFDAAVLKWLFNHEAAEYFCTLFACNALSHHTPHDLGTMAKLTGYNGPDKASFNAVEVCKGKYWHDLSDEEQTLMREYATNDTAMLAHLYNITHPLLGETEKFLIDHTITNWINPVLELDVDLCNKGIREDQDEKQRIIAESGISASRLRSPKKFAAVLTDLGIEPCERFGKTETGNPNFSKDNPEIQAATHDPETGHLFRGRIAASSNIITSRLTTFITTAEKHDGKLPVNYIYGTAQTGRFGGGNKTNLGNLPRANKTYMLPKDAIRHSLCAPEGQVLVVADLSNIESRRTHHLVENHWMVDMFRNGIDTYCVRANKIFNRADINKDDNPDERFIGKVTELSLGYRMGGMLLHRNFRSQGVNLTQEKCYDIVNGFRSDNWKLAEAWKTNDAAIHYMHEGSEKEIFPGFTTGKDLLTLPSGRTLQYTRLYMDSEAESWIYGIIKNPNRKPGAKPNGLHYLHGGVMFGHMIQADCRDIMMDMMMRIHKEVAPVIMHTYDECVCLCDENRADDVLASMLEIMAIPPSYAPDLPVKAEGGYDRKYSK